jgi:hypothetical protein
MSEDAHIARFDSVLTAILAASAEGKHTIVERMAAKELLHRFFGSTCDRLELACVGEDGAIDGALADRRSRYYEKLDADALDRARSLGTRSTEKREPVIHDRRPSFLALDVAPERDAQRLVIAVLSDAARSRDLADRFYFLARFQEGMRRLVWLVWALRGTRELARCASRIESLISDDRRSLRERIEEGTNIVKYLRMTDPFSVEHVQQVKRVAIWAVQEHLGTGWRVRRLAGESARGRVTAFRDALQQHAKPPNGAVLRGEHREDETSRLRAEIGLLADIIATDHHRADVVPKEGDRPLELLLHTTVLHEQARATHDRRAVSVGDAEWDEAAKPLASAIARLLEKQFREEQASSAQRGNAWRIGRMRTWLHTWLCHRVAHEWNGMSVVDKRPVSDPWQFRADLAYVLREGLRSYLYASGANYRFQPATYTSALLTLVEFHSTYIARVPLSYDVRRALRDIGEVTHSGRYHFATGHLRHVLEVYIAGHFISGVHVKSRGQCDGWTIAAVLAARTREEPGEEEVDRFKRVFSIAALFHDVGSGLLPELAGAPPNSGLGLSELELMQKQTVVARRALVEDCVRALTQSRTLDLDEGALKRWTEVQKERAEPDHSLLGALHLHRLSQRIPPADAGDIVAAIRAVILHGAVCERIVVEQDPAAALLVLCDEIFEWEPSNRGAPGPNAVGRALHAMAVDLPPLPAHVSHAGMDGLSVTCNERGLLEATLDITRVEPHDNWPTFRIELEHPEFLDIPAYRLLLATAQKVGRISRSQLGFGPRVFVRTAIANDADGIAQLFQRVVAESRLPIRTVIERWLSLQRAHDMPPVKGPGGVETWLLETLDPAYYVDDIRWYLPALEREVDDILRRDRVRLKSDHDI